MSSSHLKGDSFGWPSIMSSAWPSSPSLDWFSNCPLWLRSRRRPCPPGAWLSSGVSAFRQPKFYLLEHPLSQLSAAPGNCPCLFPWHWQRTDDNNKHWLGLGRSCLSTSICPPAFSSSSSDISCLVLQREKTIQLFINIWRFFKKYLAELYLEN